MVDEDKLVEEGDRELSPRELRVLISRAAFGLAFFFVLLMWLDLSSSTDDRFRAMSRRVMDAIVLRGEGEKALALGEYEVALGYFEESLAIYRRNELENGEAETLIMIGEVYAQMGDLGRARDYYEEALGIGEAEELEEIVGLARERIEGLGRP